MGTLPVEFSCAIVPSWLSSVLHFKRNHEIPHFLIFKRFSPLFSWNLDCARPCCQDRPTNVVLRSLPRNSSCSGKSSRGIIDSCVTRNWSEKTLFSLFWFLSWRLQNANMNVSNSFDCLSVYYVLLFPIVSKQRKKKSSAVIFSSVILNHICTQLKLYALFFSRNKSSLDIQKWLKQRKGLMDPSHAKKKKTKGRWVLKTKILWAPRFAVRSFE